jgi:hypothetical protein
MSQASLLRRVVMVDAATCVASGLLLLLGAGPLEPLLGLPVLLLRYAGAMLVVFALLLASLLARSVLPRGWVAAVIVGNAAWALASFVLLLSGWVAPTALGYAFVIAQALAVIVLAELEYLGLKYVATALA